MTPPEPVLAVLGGESRTPYGQCLLGRAFKDQEGGILCLMLDLWMDAESQASSFQKI